MEAAEMTTPGRDLSERRQDLPPRRMTALHKPDIANPATSP